MEKIKIALGSTADQKINYVQEVIDEIGLDAEIIPIKVSSDISEQPLTEKETIDGSVNRAKNALKQNSPGDIGLGIEVGYHLNDKRYEIFCCATIVDKSGIRVSSCSDKFPLPNFHNDKIKEGKYLGHYVMEYFKKDTHPATQFIAEMIRGRKPFIKEAVRNALLKYLKKEEL